MSEARSDLAEAQATHTLVAPRHEASDVPLRPLLLGLAAIAFAVVVMVALAAVLYPDSTTKRLVRLPLPQPAAPALQPSPRLDMAALRREQRGVLDSVGWVDRARGVAHVPVARAMQDVVRDGIADWPR